MTKLLELIKNQIYKLETELLKSEVRQSSEKLSLLLSDNFVEFCSSGSIYHYVVGDMFNNDISSYILKDFIIRELSDDCILATYKLIKTNEIDENKKYSLRSSIWKNFAGSWQMIFHQGTLTSR